MPFEINMPQLGLTMETGVVVEWLVGEGDPIKLGQEILTVETDKSVVAVEARDEGTLARILVPASQNVAVGTVLAVGVAPGETLPAAWQPDQATVDTVPAEKPSPQAIPAGSTAGGDDAFQASWKARRMARDAGLDLQTLAGSGPGNRIGAKDILLRLAEDSAPELPPTTRAAPEVETRTTPVAANLAGALGLDLSHVTGSGPEGRITQSDVLEAAAAIIRGGAERRRSAPTPGLPQAAGSIPLKGVRKIVSEGMASSVHTTARVTLFREVDASGLIALRQRFKAQGIDIAYNDLLIHICAIALHEHPAANARMGEEQIEQLDRVNVGLAVDTERGLLVPVVHHADRLSIPQIAAVRARLVDAARKGRSLPDDLSGGTFTLSNLGMYGVEGFTPIINLPECCILGVGRIVRKPVVGDDAPGHSDDAVVVRPMMKISLVFDHRVIDGAPAARFLDRIAQLIADPMLLLVLDEG
jgi:pyruvate dehydrogenase E2 component (dihydrolipoamide acetyltransferase)